MGAVDLNDFNKGEVFCGNVRVTALVWATAAARTARVASTRDGVAREYRGTTMEQASRDADDPARCVTLRAA